MATGPLMALGAVDMLIPPSALTVLLGSLSGISISKLLIGGVVPGLILSVSFVIYIIVRVKLNPALAPASTFTEYQGWEKLRPFFQYVLPLVSIFVVVVASMSAGWATPTESAAIGALFTIVLALCYRALTLNGLLLMTMKGVSPPQVRMGHIFQAVLPYIAMSLLLLALVFFIPAVAVWLPKVLL